MLGLVGTGKPGGDDGGVGQTGFLPDDGGDPGEGVCCGQVGLELPRLVIVLGVVGSTFKGLMDMGFMGKWVVWFVRVVGCLVK